MFCEHAKLRGGVATEPSDDEARVVTAGCVYNQNMTPGKSILFVCTGNTFRSVAAEQGFKKYLSDNAISDWTVGSAGIFAEPAIVDPKTTEALRALGVTDFVHNQRRLSKELLAAYDIVVGMAENHIEFMRSQFNYKYGLLFNELAANENTSVWDIENEVGDYLTNRPAVEGKIERTVHEIVEKIPAVFEGASVRFYLFQDFIDGKKAHRNGYPFITLYETPLSIAFMSTDIPSHEDGHVLVIPKKRYANLTDVPDEMLQDMLNTVKKVGAAVLIDHDGYNILLNNGLDAGQFIMHAHMHIIPRRRGDGITMEGWGHPKISRDDFISINEKLRDRISQALSSTVQ
jgi:diadenosine tetraphosphate (Ap4A) HIT family hydrolase/protein-tyrosine-phosphatase